MDADSAAKLRAAFAPGKVGKLPRVWCRACSQNKAQKHCDQHKLIKCDVCHAKITEAHLHLDYVGHAAVTDRLLQVDPEWTWWPMALDPSGAPLFDKDGGLWIMLKVCGIQRPGYGDQSNGKGAKEVIGDAIRNAAMRFGVGLDLWSKEPLDAEQAPREDGARSAQSARPSAERAPTPPKTTKSQQQKIAIAASDAGIDAELRHRITRLLFGVTSSKDVQRGDVNRLLDAFKSFSEKPDANMKYLEQWEADHLPPSTAAQALREGVRDRDRAPSPSGSSPPTAAEPGGDTITPEELEAAGQTTMSDVIPE